MTELDLAVELGVVKKRSNGLGRFDNTIILNQRLINYILSLKKEKDEREVEIDEDFELAEEEEDDISPMSTPHCFSKVSSHLAKPEMIFELPPLKADFEWEKCGVVIDHPTHKPRKILSIKSYKIRKFKEMEEELFSEENFSTYDDRYKEMLIKAKEAADNYTEDYNMAS